jgi:hypothetical protein
MVEGRHMANEGKVGRWLRAGAWSMRERVGRYSARISLDIIYI